MAKVSKLRERISLALLVVLIPGIAWSWSSLESNSLYHPDAGEYPVNPIEAVQGTHLEKQVQDVYFSASDGVKLNAWFVPPKDGMPTVLLAHGNGGNIADRSVILSRFTEKGYGFLMFDYRGYGKSEGVSEEKGLYKDFHAASDYLADKQRIPVSEQIAFGESLGSAVAVEAASGMHFRAVILSPALTSAPATAKHLLQHNLMGVLSFLPTNLIMKQDYDSLSRIGKITSPLLIMHGDADTLTPLWMAKTLYEKSSAAHKKLLIIPGAGHNTVFSRGQDQLLTELESLLEKSRNTASKKS